jgi:hypothetical protein
MSKVRDAKVFSVLDTNNGFWNIELDESSSKLCTFNTPFGRYRFKRLPFGLKCSSEIFQRKIVQCFEGIDGVEIYVDDILVWGTSQKDHDERLKLVLERARKYNIKFNVNKCKFSVNEVRYCYVILFSLFLKTVSNDHERKLKSPNFTGGNLNNDFGD